MTSPPADPPRRNLTGAIVPALAAAAIAGVAIMMLLWPRPIDPPVGCITAGLEHFGGPINLVDQNNHRVTQADFAARPAVLYFGYTHCPDACPTTLYALGQMLSAPHHPDVQPVFISVDPARDTPAVLRDYSTTNGFPTRLVSLTGAEAAVKAAADAFRVVYRKAPIEGADAENYNVDHTSLLYVVDGAWRTRAVMSTPGATPATIAACIKAGLTGRP
jgi:protein SCO1/2